VTLAAFALLLGVTGPHLASLYVAYGLDSCHGSSCPYWAAFDSGRLTFGSYIPLYDISISVILVAPAVIGLFWGAPLIARELETGTCALAWNQSVTRNRWLTVKLTVGALSAMAVTEGLSLMQAWWATPIGRTVADADGIGPGRGRFTPLVFASHGITSLGCAAFAFAFGVAAGALTRRTIPAMVLTLAIFAAVQIAMPLWIRPNLIPREHARIPLASFSFPYGGTYVGSDPYTFTFRISDIPGQPGSWILSSSPVNAAGRPDTLTPAACAKPPVLSSPAEFASCLDHQGFREAVSYQPASRYWPLQWIETGIYLTLALLPAGYSTLRLRRRPS
jgi:hypothetical protein